PIPGSIGFGSRTRSPGCPRAAGTSWRRTPAIGSRSNSLTSSSRPSGPCSGSGPPQADRSGQSSRQRFRSAGIGSNCSWQYSLGFLTVRPDSVCSCFRGGGPTMKSPSLRLPPLFPPARVVLLLLALCVIPSRLTAQVLYGSVVGNVTDGTGGAMPGATVTLTDKETGVSRDVVSDAAGAYRFSTVQSGTYTVTVKMDGFRTYTRSDIPVTLNNVTRVDAAMQVGQLSETVTVSAESPVLQTDRAEVRAELKAKELVNLPVSMNR